MDVKVAKASIPSAIPNDQYVGVLRDKGFEVYVFQKKGRRMVAIKFPYGEGEAIYDTYDSELEDHGSFPLKTLTQRNVEAFKNDPTFTWEGP
ncbi:MAG: hypothetical protein LBS22_02930 [Puniceicoccales bacterium]|jgi:hypothetical protein|nr:hypothetical protein [Puniceicoccales bacterium]